MSPGVKVPACDRERQRMTLPAEAITTLMLSPDYWATIPATIADLSPTIPADVAATTDRALLAAATIPRSHDPLLLRLEAFASSAIENIHPTYEDLTLAAARTPTDPQVRLVHDHTLALDRALNTPLNDHHTLQGLITRASLKHPGTLRTGAAWVGGRLPQWAVFVPPAAERLPETLADLHQFAGRTDLPVLVHAALTHAQFETIHPYPDGNGRTGRALITQILTNAGLPPLPLSQHLNRHRQTYYDTLSAYRDGDATPITSLLTDALITAAETTRTLLADLHHLHTTWADRLTGIRHDALAHRLLPHLTHTPATTNTHLRHHHHTTWTPTQRAIDTLIDHGILTPTGDHPRNRTYTATEALHAHTRTV